MLSDAPQQAAVTRAPWALHPTLTALQPSLQITADCWALLAAPDGTSRKEHYLPKGEREPDTAYRKRLDAARPSGFFRDAPAFGHERLDVPLGRRGKPVKKVRFMLMAKAHELARKLQGRANTSISVI